MGGVFLLFSRGCENGTSHNALQMSRVILPWNGAEFEQEAWPMEHGVGVGVAWLSSSHNALLPPPPVMHAQCHRDWDWDIVGLELGQGDQP